MRVGGLLDHESARRFGGPMAATGTKEIALLSNFPKTNDHIQPNDIPFLGRDGTVSVGDVHVLEKSVVVTAPNPTCVVFVEVLHFFHFEARFGSAGS